jgi:hypothetical protein
MEHFGHSHTLPLCPVLIMHAVNHCGLVIKDSDLGFVLCGINIFIILLLKIYIIINFKIYKINWDTCKLIRITILIKKKLYIALATTQMINWKQQ